jgi:hypothetical protein
MRKRYIIAGLKHPERFFGFAKRKYRVWRKLSQIGGAG